MERGEIAHYDQKKGLVDPGCGSTETQEGQWTQSPHADQYSLGDDNAGIRQHNCDCPVVGVVPQPGTWSCEWSGGQIG